MDLASVPLAPTATDNATVIVWVVAVLVFGLGWLVRAIYLWIQDGRKECREENARAWAEVAKRDHTILELTVKSIEAQNAAAAATNRLGEAIQELTTAVRGSGPHKAVK